MYGNVYYICDNVWITYTVLIEDYFEYGGGSYATWTNPVITLTDLQVN